MSTEYTMDQLVGRINVVDNDVKILGQRGVVRDESTTAGTQLRVQNTGCPVGVIVCRKQGATAGMVGGLGATFLAGSEGTEVDALSAAAGMCDGVIDPGLTTALADEDTFLLFTSGPVAVTSGGAFTAGDQVKPGASGKFVAVTGNEQGIGRAMETASGADETKRVFLNCNITQNGLIA